MTSRPENAWLFGPIPDLLFGAGLLYLIIITAVSFAGSATGGVISPATFPVLILIFSGAHYGGTLIRVFEHAEERRTYRFFTLHATVLMIVVLLGALYSPLAGSILITVYLTWSPWHYTGQNYGIAVMFLRRRGVDISPAAKRWLYASFVLSYLSVFLNFHFEGGIGQAYPVGYAPDTSAGFEFVSLELPGAIRSILLPSVGLGYVVSLAAAGFLLVRASSLRTVAPVALIAVIQAAWFAIPHLAYYAQLESNLPAFTLKGGNNFEAYFVWAALGHAIQYLWITSYYARKDARWTGFTRYFTKTFVFGNAVWAAPLILLGPDTLGRPDYEGGLALCVAAAVNLHHFIVDGAIWKLRNPKIAAVLLRSAEVTAGEAMAVARSAWTAKVGWAVAGVCAFTLLLPSIELDQRFPRALMSRDYDTAEAILDRAALYGRDSAKYRTILANQLSQDRLHLKALPHYWRSLELQPQANGYLQVGILSEQIRGTEFALHAWEKGVAQFPDDVPLNRRLGLALVSLRRMDEARPYLERAAQLDPEDAHVESALRRTNARAAAPD